MKWTSIKRFCPRYSRDFAKPAPVILPVPSSHRYLAAAYSHRAPWRWR